MKTISITFAQFSIVEVEIADELYKEVAEGSLDPVDLPDEVFIEGREKSDLDCPLVFEIDI